MRGTEGPENICCGEHSLILWLLENHLLFVLENDASVLIPLSGSGRSPPPPPQNRVTLRKPNLAAIFSSLCFVMQFLVVRMQPGRASPHRFTPGINMRLRCPHGGTTDIRRYIFRRSIANDPIFSLSDIILSHRHVFLLL